MDYNLQKIEEKMRETADRWRETRPTSFERTHADPLEKAELCFDTFEKFKDAVVSIEQKLSSQRRMARARHPRYDVNKHIQLKTALTAYVKSHPHWAQHKT